jgi:hypothetical protein
MRLTIPSAIESRRRFWFRALFNGWQSVVGLKDHLEIAFLLSAGFVLAAGIGIALGGQWWTVTLALAVLLAIVLEGAYLTWRELDITSDVPLELEIAQFSGLAYIETKNTWAYFVLGDIFIINRGRSRVVLNMRLVLPVENQAVATDDRFIYAISGCRQEDTGIKELSTISGPLPHLPSEIVLEGNGGFIRGHTEFRVDLHFYETHWPNRAWFPPSLESGVELVDIISRQVRPIGEHEYWNG